MLFTAEVPDELAPLIEGAFVQQFGGLGEGYQDMIPNPDPDPGDGSWQPEIPNPLNRIGFAGQCIARFIIEVVQPYAREQAALKAQSDVDAQFASLPPIVISGT